MARRTNYFKTVVQEISDIGQSITNLNDTASTGKSIKNLGRQAGEVVKAVVTGKSGTTSDKAVPKETRYSKDFKGKTTGTTVTGGTYTKGTKRN
jgi:uncharacterized protein YoxC